MYILALQMIDGVLVLWFALLALRVARLEAGHARAPQRSAWWLAGGCYLLIGVSSIVQDAAGTWAFIAGPGSQVWNTFLHWMPLGNHGRGMLIIALAAMLLVNSHPATARGRWLRGAAWVAYAAALLLGGALGWSENGQMELHFAATAVLNAAEMIAMFLALAVALPTHSMGRYLWLALAADTLVLVHNVGWFSVLASARQGAWTPSAVTMRTFITLIALLMVGLAAWRLTLARRGVRAYALLEAPEWRGGGVG